MTTQEMMSVEEFEKMLSDSYTYKLNVADVVKGVIVKKEKDGYLVDIGAKQEAFLPNREVTNFSEQNPDDIVKLWEEKEFYVMKDEVTICGLLSKVVSKPTKKDPSKILKIGTIEDLSGGRVEFISFPKVTEQFGQMIANDEKVILTGRINVREGEDEINIAVVDVQPIQNVNLVTIKMLQHFAFEENEYLKGLLAKYGGNSPVVIDFEDPESANDDKRVQILANKRLWVNPDSELIETVNKAFGGKLELSVRTLGK